MKPGLDSFDITEIAPVVAADFPVVRVVSTLTTLTAASFCLRDQSYFSRFSYMILLVSVDLTITGD